MIQLYTKSFDGTFEKVDWRLLKVIPVFIAKKAIKKATLHKVNAYNNADFEGFIDKEILLKELEIKIQCTNQQT